MGSVGVVTGKGSVDSSHPDDLRAQGRAQADPDPDTGPHAGPIAVRQGVRPGYQRRAVDYYSNEYTFMNLVSGHGWVDTNNGWQSLPNGQLDTYGMPKQVPTNKSYAYVMTPPSQVFNGQSVAIRCTWAGSGDVNIAGRARTWSAATMS